MMELPHRPASFQHGQTGARHHERQFFAERSCAANPSPAPAHAAHWRHHAADHHRLPRSAGGRAVMGLPRRCSYSPQPRTVDATTPAEMDWRRRCWLLRKRRDLLDGVVSPGEKAHAAKRACRGRWNSAPGLCHGPAHRRRCPERPAAVPPQSLTGWGSTSKGPEHRHADITGAPTAVPEAFESLTFAGQPPSRWNAAPPGTPGCKEAQELQMPGRPAGRPGRTPIAIAGLPP